ncbi:MAG TPA: tRNA adenosine(34) deaminase TadA [Actinomycetota bacterium]|nr:tRNA adenosine(34) deaminase TadA [Actinomycetota bacterium]
MDDAAFMDAALEQARAAATHGDVPIGCVVVRDGEIVSRAGNARERDTDPTAHAEILALRAAAQRAGEWRLSDHTLYVTVEPCAMCAGAIVLARIGRLVYGADDPKAGAVHSLYDIPRDPRLNHHVPVTSGVRAEESAAVLRDFFSSQRR